ncbi:hypothetical protein BVRB_4g079170 isoform A [Beta vulgaris subsp. vulgaris]|nr:hypothetical protein BVRB_4g079170 isoform A [Beta vulgaris subsp. vulgaris]
MTFLLTAVCFFRFNKLGSLELLLSYIFGFEALLYSHSHGSAANWAFCGA